MISLGSCRACEAKSKNIQLLENHIKFLENLVDKLLAKQGVMLKEEPEEVPRLTEEDKILANGGDIYGQ